MKFNEAQSAYDNEEDPALSEDFCKICETDDFCECTCNDEFDEQPVLTNDEFDAFSSNI